MGVPFPKGEDLNIRKGSRTRNEEGEHEGKTGVSRRLSVRVGNDHGIKTAVTRCPKKLSRDVRKGGEDLEHVRSEH